MRVARRDPRLHADLKSDGGKEDQKAKVLEEVGQARQGKVIAIETKGPRKDAN